LIIIKQQQKSASEKTEAQKRHDTRLEYINLSQANSLFCF